jgi:hypothetical protein
MHCLGTVAPRPMISSSVGAEAKSSRLDALASGRMTIPNLDEASVLQLICEWVVHSVTIPQEQIKAFGRCEAGTMASA